MLVLLLLQRHTALREKEKKTEEASKPGEHNDGMKNEMLSEPCYVAYTSTDAKLIVAAHFCKNLRMLLLRGGRL
ncbi:unnamed protein product [Cylicocyclus nassatus]|uniref:Uncharacterized protein n=1 Tax=Cylicocyclus nassatus TaxID=53992 RepID=A0AA36GM06_CYLNA|nr:unnamed protein product [Cylicocyclus nassatus]